jgi:hypothetical protein
VRSSGWARRCLLLCVLWASGATALAQQPPDDPVASTEVRFGAFGLNPGGWISAGYDGNVTREADQVISGPTLHASPQLQVWWRAGSTFVGVLGALEYIQVAQQGKTTLEGQPKANTLGAVTVSRPGKRLFLNGDFAFKSTNARPTGFEVGARSRHTDKTLRVEARVSPAPRLSISATGAYNQVGYDAAAIYDGSPLHQTLSYKSNSVGIGATVGLSPLSSVFASVDRGQQVFQYLPERDNSSITTLGGFTFRPQALLSGTISAGYRFSRSDYPGAASIGIEAPLSGPVISVQLAHIRPSGAIFSVSYLRDQFFSYDYERGTFVSRQLAGNVFLNPVFGWNPYFSAWVADLSYTEPEPAVARHFEYLVGASHQMRRYLRVGVLVNGFKHFNITGSGPEYQGTRAFVFLMLGQRNWWRQLDLPLPPL